MTNEERLEYNKLSCEDKRVYDRTMEDWPNWPHSKRMSKVAIEHAILESIPDDDGGIIIDDPTFQHTIYVAMKDFLIGIGGTSMGVIKILDSIIDGLADLIVRGIKSVGNYLSKFWEWLNS